VGGTGLAVGDAVGVGFVVGVGVGVGGGGAGMGMMTNTMLRTMIRLRTQKTIWLSLACDLREPRFTTYLLLGWQPVRDLFQPNYTIDLASMPKHSIPQSSQQVRRTLTLKWPYVTVPLLLFYKLGDLWYNVGGKLYV